MCTLFVCISFLGTHSFFCFTVSLSDSQYSCIASSLLEISPWLTNELQSLLLNKTNVSVVFPTSCRDFTSVILELRHVYPATVHSFSYSFRKVSKKSPAQVHSQIRTSQSRFEPCRTRADVWWYSDIFWSLSLPTTEFTPVTQKFIPTLTIISTCIPYSCSSITVCIHCRIGLSSKPILWLKYHATPAPMSTRFQLPLPVWSSRPSIHPRRLSLA